MKIGLRCRICAGREVCPVDQCNSLYVKRPEFRAQWDSVNGSMKDYTAVSHDVVWWSCPFCKNRWQCAIHKRGCGGCPYCRGSRVAPNTSLAGTHPHLLSEWMAEINGPAEKVRAGCNEKYWWRCSADPHHIWEACPNHRTKKKKPTGCPYCNQKTICRVDYCNSLWARCRESRPQLIDEWASTNPDMKTVFPSAAAKFKWICAVDEEHTWWAHSYNRLRGDGCPHCYAWKSEQCARGCFEELLPGYEFPKSRLSFMERLELDGYCAQLALAFEYDGEQHVRHVTRFHRTKKEFIRQQERDRRKTELCRINGIHLIRVPHTFDSSKRAAMLAFIDGKVCEWRREVAMRITEEAVV